MPRYVIPDMVEQARKVDLFSYLQATTPDELVRCGAEEYCTREHDSLKISHGKWYWWSRGIGGASALDYLVKGLGMDFVSAVEAVMNQTPVIQSTSLSKHEKPYKKPTCLRLPKYTFLCNAVKNYLQERGIDRDIIDHFIERKQIAESVKTGAALFFGKDKNGNVRQCSERATDGTPNKKDTYGSDRSYCFFSEARVPCTSVSVFESAIDLMSFVTIMKRRGLDFRRFHMLSLSGVYLPGKNEKEFRIPASLERFLREYPDTKAIYLHLDSDYAGRRGAAGFITVLGDRYDVRYLPPKYGKDYNDYLMHLIHLENLKTERTQKNELRKEKTELR